MSQFEQVQRPVQRPAPQLQAADVREEPWPPTPKKMKTQFKQWWRWSVVMMPLVVAFWVWHVSMGGVSSVKLPFDLSISRGWDVLMVPVWVALVVWGVRRKDLGAQLFVVIFLALVISHICYTPSSYSPLAAFMVVGVICGVLGLLFGGLLFFKEVRSWLVLDYLILFGLALGVSPFGLVVGGFVSLFFLLALLVGWVLALLLKVLCQIGPWKRIWNWLMAREVQEEGRARVNPMEEATIPFDPDSLDDADPELDGLDHTGVADDLGSGIAELLALQQEAKALGIYYDSLMARDKQIQFLKNRIALAKLEILDRARARVESGLMDLTQEPDHSGIEKPPVDPNILPPGLVGKEISGESASEPEAPPTPSAPIVQPAVDASAPTLPPSPAVPPGDFSRRSEH